LLSPIPPRIPRDCFPKQSPTQRPNAALLPKVPDRFKKYCSENVLSGRGLHNFSFANPAR
jgi:hypothetical protein